MFTEDSTLAIAGFQRTLYLNTKQNQEELFYLLHIIAVDFQIKQHIFHSCVPLYEVNTLKKNIRGSSIFFVLFITCL